MSHLTSWVLGGHRWCSFGILSAVVSVPSGVAGRIRSWRAGLLQSLDMNQLPLLDRSRLPVSALLPFGYQRDGLGHAYACHLNWSDSH